MLNSDSLIERSYLRRKLTFWRTLAIIIFVLLLLKLFSVSGFGKYGKVGLTPHIARITVSEIIDRDTEREEILKEIAEDPSIVGVIVTINSPGGSAVGGETLYKSLKELNEKKPVVTVMDSIATSAAYLAPLGTSRIFAHNGTITGSIGVIMQLPNVKELTDKMGVKFDFVKTSPLKGSPSPFEASTPESLAVLDKMVQDFYVYFIDVIAKERKMEVSEVKKLADGRVYSAVEAQKLKLIDEVGGEPEAIKWLVDNKNVSRDAKVEDHELKREETPFSKLMGSVTNLKNLTFGLTESMKVKGLVSIWQN